MLLEQALLPALGGVNRTFYVDAAIAGNIVNFVAQAREAGINVTVHETFRTTAQQRADWIAAQANGGLNRFGNPVGRPGESLHEAGFAIDLNGASVNKGQLNPEQRAELERIARENELTPYGRKDEPHFSANPKNYGYSSREEAIKENQADYESLQRRSSDATSAIATAPGSYEGESGTSSAPYSGSSAKPTSK